ncbi:MAG: ABC transporter permease [Terriglobia bacterium]
MRGLRLVLRRLRRAPGFTAISLLTIALGVGATMAIFSVVDGVLLKPLPYPHADRLVGVWLSAPGIHWKQGPLSPSDYFIFREQGRAFQDIGLYMDDMPTVKNGRGAPERARALDVTDGVLPILGVTPALGRSFTRTEDSPSGGPATVMISYGYWQRSFSGSASALGKTITVNGKPTIIIGVLPRKFTFLDQSNPVLVLPLRLDRSKTDLGEFNYNTLARLKPGATVAEANADVGRMLPIVLRSFPPPHGFTLKIFEDVGFGPKVHPLKRDVVGDVGSVLWVIMGGIGLVLLIACANVANLLLVRAEGRQQELAIRAALGATPRRIAGELLFESLVLSMLGSAIGLGLAYGALRALVAAGPVGLPRLNEIGINGTVLMFTLAIAAAVSLLFGSAPVLKYAGARAGSGLREGGRSQSAGRERHRARNTLVVVQVALAIVLLISSGLMIRTFRALTRVHAGFSAPSTLETFYVYISDEMAKTPDQVVHVESNILRSIQAVPGVVHASVSMSIPLEGNHWNDPVFARDHVYRNGELARLRRFNFPSPGYFKTLGTPLIAGREFTWNDEFNHLPVAIVSEDMAKELWGSPANALDKQIRISQTGPWREVVGVAGNVYYDGVDKPPVSAVYWPLLRNDFETQQGLSIQRYVAFAVRSPLAGSGAFTGEIRQAVDSAVPGLPLWDIHRLDYFYKQSLSRETFTLVMLAIAGAMALVLAIIGLYGVIAYSVAQRTREVGIRMALGAQPREVAGLFLRHALMLTAVGIVCGLGTALALMRLMAALLYGVKSADPLTYGLVSAGLLIVAALACYIPARRATQVEPVIALRYE